MSDTTQPGKSLVRDRIERALERWGHTAYRRAGWVLAAALLVVAGLATQIPQIQFDTSTEGFLPDDNPVRVAYEDFRDRYGRETDG